MSDLLAIIGGTGLTALATLQIIRKEMVSTPYGEPSGPLTHGVLAGHDVVFLARHGYGHTIPPHQVNYRANLWALRHIGVDQVIAITAVGGITPRMAPGMLVIPDQIIDYTYGRQQTLFEGDLAHVTHIDFTYPYDEALRTLLIDTAREQNLPAVERGVYGATQGPRLETAAEIARMERDGCDLVGMTGMPEASLARELGLAYACCSVVANWGAGKGPSTITMDEIERTLLGGMAQVRTLLRHLIPKV